MEKEKAQRELLVEILSDFHTNELEGKDFDFYFVLRSKLDELNKKLQTNN